MYVACRSPLRVSVRPEDVPVQRLVLLSLPLQRVFFFHDLSGSGYPLLPCRLARKRLLDRLAQGADVADLGQPARLAGTDHVGDAADVEASYLRI